MERSSTWFRRFWSGSHAPLGDHSGGDSRRAAGILVAAHLLPIPVAAALWLFGLLSVFDDHRWIPVGLATAVAVLSVLGLLLFFGAAGTIRTGGRGYGETYAGSFSRGAALGLFWLRWFMQIVLVTGVMLFWIFTWTDVRWWYIFGTDEIRSLSGRVEALPVPDDWEPTRFRESGYGFFTGLDGVDSRSPEGWAEQRFDVPRSFRFDDVEPWLRSPVWASSPDAFGEIRLEQCDRESQWCDAHLVPVDGGHPEYFLRVWYSPARSEFRSPDVRIRLTYRQYVEPRWDVSRATIDRAEQIPIPSDWVRFDLSASTNINGDQVRQRFAVPESYTAADLDEWLSGPAWTSPASGEPFGAIRKSYPCEQVDDRFGCSVIVVATERKTPDQVLSPDGPVESLRVALRDNQTVSVSFSRNG